MKTLKGLITSVFVLIATVVNAQMKNEKTESVKVYGNCGMCKTTIEKAANIKDVASVVWDKNTKMAALSYDSTRTNKDEILKRIAAVGYDSDTFTAPDNVYAELPACCQYERPTKTENTATETTKAENSKHNR